MRKGYSLSIAWIEVSSSFLVTPNKINIHEYSSLRRQIPFFWQELWGEGAFRKEVRNNILVYVFEEKDEDEDEEQQWSCSPFSSWRSLLSLPSWSLISFRRFLYYLALRRRHFRILDSSSRLVRNRSGYRNQFCSIRGCCGATNNKKAILTRVKRSWFLMRQLFIKYMDCMYV